MVAEAEKSVPAGELPLFAGRLPGFGGAAPVKAQRGGSLREERLRELDRELASLRTYALVARNGRVREVLRREAERLARRRRKLLAAAAET